MPVQRYWYEVLPSSVLTLLCPPIPFVPSLRQYIMLEGWPASSPGGVCVSFSDSIEPIHGNCYGRGIQVTKFFQGRLMIQGQRGRCSFQSHLCLSPIGAWTLQMPVPYSPPSVESYTQTPSHDHSYSAVGAQITSLRLGDLVVPKLPRLHADVSDWGDLSLHQ